jgi:CHAT domain-containing protein/tetratricopeptide (TPR) repeat protein
VNNQESIAIATLNELAVAYLEAGKYAEALPRLKQALELTTDEPSCWRIATLSNLGTAFRYLGNDEVAIGYSRDGLLLCDRLQGEDKTTIRFAWAKLTCNLGALYRRAKRFAESELAFKKAFELLGCERPAAGEHLVAWSVAHYGLGLLLLDMGEDRLAKPHLDQAFEATKLAFGESSLKYAVQLSTMADWNTRQGDMTTGVRLHEQATAIYRHRYGQEHPNYAFNLCSLSSLYHAMRWNAKAEAALREAEAIFKAKLGEQNATYRECLNSLGVALAHSEKWSEAEQCLQRSLHLAADAHGPRSAEYAAGLHNFIVLLPHMSPSSLIRVLAEFIQTDEMRPTLQATFDQYLTLMSKGFEGIQLAFLEKIAAIERDAGMSDSANFAMTLFSLGQGYRLENLEKAEECLREALRLQRKHQAHSHSQLILHLSALADLCAAIGKTREALSLMTEAAEVEDRMASQVFVTGSEAERTQYVLALRRSFYVFLSLVLEFFQNAEDAVESAFELTLRRKALGSETLSAQREAILSGKYPQLAPCLTEWRDLRAQIARLTLSGPEAHGEEWHRERLAELFRRKETLESGLARQIPEMGLSKRLEAADRFAVWNALPQDAALVELVLLERFDFTVSPSGNQWKEGRYVAFVCAKAEPVTVTMLDIGPSDIVDSLLAEFRSATTGPERARHFGDLVGQPGNTEKSASESGAKLRQIVFDPLSSLLMGASKLFIATDGNLTRLPFGALPIADGYLIDHYEINYLNSGRDLLRGGESQVPCSFKPVVVADPDFDLASDCIPVPKSMGSETEVVRNLARSGIRFTRLPGTRAEGEEVGRLLQVTPLVEKQALKGTIRKTVSPKILHIATHGFFRASCEGDAKDSSEGELGNCGPILATRAKGYFTTRIQNPLLRAGLAVAGANRTLAGEGGLPTEAEDGILTAEDVALMDLSGTELVVLSACETGLGDVLAGEGVYGLQRAVGAAGAKTLVMSLWKVPDQQTRELIVKFYRGLLTGLPRGAALREAQRAMMVRYRNPYYWGAFVCHGDDSPILIQPTGS